MLTLRGLGTVLRDLAAMGYAARWGVFSAADVGALHIRERIWILANASPFRTKPCLQGIQTGSIQGKLGGMAWRDWIQRMDQPVVVGNRDDVAGWLDRHESIGNGQVPAVAELAWRTLSEGII